MAHDKVNEILNAKCDPPSEVKERCDAVIARLKEDIRPFREAGKSNDWWQFYCRDFD